MKDSQKARTLPPVIAAKRQCLAVCLLALILWLVLCVANCGFAQTIAQKTTAIGNNTASFIDYVDPNDASNKVEWTENAADAFMVALEYWSERFQEMPQYGQDQNFTVTYADVDGRFWAMAGGRSVQYSITATNDTYDRPTQVTGGNIYNSVTECFIHEIGHATGFISGGSGTYYPGAWGDGLQGTGNQYFTGTNTLAVYGDVVYTITNPAYADQWSGHPNIWCAVMTGNYEEPYRERPFYSEVELAILKDCGWTIDLKKSFGKSYYDKTDGKGGLDAAFAAVNTQGFNSNYSYGIGLHIATSNASITQNANITASGVDAAGVRVERNNNKVIINNGITVAANGERGIGFLSIWGSGTTFINQGTITATGSNGTGVWFAENPDDANTAEIAGFYNSGTINAGTSGNNAIYIGNNVTITGNTMDFMNGSDVTGNIVNGSNTSIDLTFGKLAGSGGIAGTGGDENAVISINGNIGTAINQFSLQVWGGTTTLAKDTTSYFTAGVIGADTHAKSTLIVNGDATFGSLDIKNNGENSATLRGIGTITANSGVTNHGVVAPGDTDKPGTLTINGNFTSAADGAILVRAGDLLQVNGTATVSEGTLLVDVDETFIQNKKYVFLKADTLTVTTPLTDPPSAVANGQLNPNFDITADYEDGSDGTYWFQIIRGSSGENTVGNMVRPHVIIVDNYNGAPFSYVSLGKTPNQREMGRYFDVIDASLSPVRFSDLDLAVYQFDHIDARKTGLVNNVLDELSGSLYGTMNTISFQDTTFLHSTLADVLRRGPVAGSMQIKDNVWGMSYAYKGNMQAETNAGKVRSDLFGLIAGFDRVRNSRTRLGGFLSFGGGEIKGSVSDKTATEELTLGLYYRHDWDNSYILAQAGLGRHNYDTQRYLEVFNRTAASKHHAYLGSLHLEAGKRYMRPFGYWHPFLGVQGIYLTRSSFTETGAGSLNLTAPEEDFYSLRQMFGMRFDSFPIPLYNGETSLGAVSIYGNATWMYEFDMGTRHTEFTAGFTGLPNQTFTVHGNDPNRDWGILGVGVNYDITTKARAFLGYDSIVNRSQVIHAANIGFILQR